MGMYPLIEDQEQRIVSAMEACLYADYLHRGGDPAKAPPLQAYAERQRIIAERHARAILALTPPTASLPAGSASAREEAARRAMKAGVNWAGAATQHMLDVEWKANSSFWLAVAEAALAQPHDDETKGVGS